MNTSVTQAKTKRKPNKQIVRNDLNLEKWAIFTTHHQAGYRVLERNEPQPDGTIEKKRVIIGIKGATETLTTDEGKIFYLFIDLWNKQFRNPEGKVFVSINKIVNSLNDYGMNISTRAGGWQKKWLMEKFRKLQTIPIYFEESYEDKKAARFKSEAFQLFTKVEMFTRKLGNDYTDKSYFQINPLIIKSIIDKNIKPVRLDVILSLKNPTSIIIYRWLDLVIADKPSIEKDIFDMAAELGFGAERPDHLVDQIREACQEINGKDISTGKITSIEVVKTVSGNSWKIVVVKGKQTMAIPEHANEPVNDKSDDELERYMAIFNQLPEEQKTQLKDEAMKILLDNKSITATSELSRDLQIVELIKSRKISI